MFKIYCHTWTDSQRSEWWRECYRKMTALLIRFLNLRERTHLPAIDIGWFEEGAVVTESLDLKHWTRWNCNIIFHAICWITQIYQNSWASCRTLGVGTYSRMIRSWPLSLSKVEHDRGDILVYLTTATLSDLRIKIKLRSKQNRSSFIIHNAHLCRWAPVPQRNCRLQVADRRSGGWIRRAYAQFPAIPHHVVVLWRGSFNFLFRTDARQKTMLFLLCSRLVI